jgi:hypothetical protein
MVPVLDPPVKAAALGFECAPEALAVFRKPLPQTLKYKTHAPSQAYSGDFIRNRFRRIQAMDSTGVPRDLISQSFSGREALDERIS